MEDLKKLVSEKAGITEGQATIATEVILQYVKDRLPTIVHNQMDKIFAGQSLEESIRNQVEELGSEVKDRTEGLAKDLKSAFESAFKSKKDKV